MTINATTEEDAALNDLAEVGSVIKEKGTGPIIFDLME